MSEQIAQAGSGTLARIALIVVTLVGMAMCTPGIGKVASTGQWLTFQGIFGSLIGVLVLVIVAARLLNWHIPVIETDTAAIAAVVLLAALKIGMTTLFPLPA
jgi:hypothetical protein